MNASIKTAFFLAVCIIAGTALSYTLSNRSNPTGFYAAGSIDGYNLESPETRLVLPEILFEISGLTDIDLNTVACVQDEDGLVFLYDLQENKIKNQFNFGDKGDYEGITRVGKALYILRSDGRLFEVSDYDSDDFQVTEYDTDIPVKNNEGLAYDSANNRLLIAGKSEAKEAKFKDRGEIKAVNPLDKKLFNQAEGITFLENGDMVISNEGKKDEPTLLRFKYR